jgi:hypothetical protein
MRKKKHFTLIEVLIACTLLSFLLSSLFFWYGHTLRERKKMTNLKKIILEERYAEQRLFPLLTKANLKPFFYLSEENPTIIKGKSLVFTFDAGPQPDPLLSNNVLGCLYIDKTTQTLCLGIWPHPDTRKTQPSKTLILLENVTELAFDFYYPPEQLRGIVNPEKINPAKPKEGWNKEWKKEFQEIPSGIVITMTRLPLLPKEKGRTISFAFELERLKYPIIYPKPPIAA